jgi:hypothetical protein
MRDQVSHTHKELLKKSFFIFSNIYTLDSRREDKELWNEWWQAFPKLNRPSISSRIKFSLLVLLSKHFDFAIILKNALAF